MQALLEPIGNASAQLEVKLAGILKETGKYPKSYKDYVPTLPFSVSQIEARTGLIISLVKGLLATPVEKFNLVPTTRLLVLGDNIRGIDAAVDSLLGQVAQLTSFGGVSSFEPSNGNFVAANGQQVSFGHALSNLASAIDAALDNYIIVAGVVRPKSTGTFVAAAQLLSENASQSAGLIEQIKAQSAEQASLLDDLRASSESARGSQTEIARILGEIEKLRATSEENESKIRTALSTIDETREKASTLQSEVSEYEKQFRAFQSALDGRDDRLKKGDEELERITQSFRDQDEAVASLISQANTMLGSATVAGLSAHYDAKYQSLDKQVNAAKVSFYGSLAFLIFSVLIVLNIVHWDGLYLPDPFPGVSADTPTGAIAVRALSAFGVRVMVILPALLLAAFASKRHSTLFRLREEYNHKFTAAASVNGFKAQAPNYEEQIAGAVFQELLINPANSMDEERKKKPNGFIEKIIGPTVESAVQKMTEIPIKE
jgi:archaellum component FlaC